METQPKDEILKKVITVADITYKDSPERTIVDGKPTPTWTLVNIVDENNNKYSCFTTKKDGTSTKAFEAIQKSEVNKTDMVGIAYKEGTYTYKKPDGTQGEGTRRNAIWFFPPNDIQAPIEQRTESQEDIQF